VIVSFLFAFSNGMEVDGFHIRVDLTGQNKKVEKQSILYWVNHLSLAFVDAWIFSIFMFSA